MLPADGRQASFGPEVSWPAGYPDTEYRDSDYRYGAPAAAQPPAASQGQHPYAAFTAAGYGDDGYRDPGYQGPAAQDAGIAGTRTVRGFVEQGRGQGQAGYPAPDGSWDGYAQPGYPQAQAFGYPQGNGPGYPQGQAYSQPGYAGSSYAPPGQIEMAYPSAAPSPESYDGAQTYQQPWDYNQPLRYEDEVAYPAQDGYRVVNEYGSGVYPALGGDGAVGRQAPAYGRTDYNGSDYSMPGVNGPGYDLSGIIGTSDFDVVGYDEPSYDRLAYDDPRYNYNEPRARFDGPRFDETRLDNLWLPGEDVRQEAAPVGYGNDGFSGGLAPSGYSDFDRGQRSGRSDETRFDMSAVGALDLDHTRFDVPAFDETRIDNLGAPGPGMGLRATGATLLAPPVAQPRSWAEDTSLDHFADLDLTDEPVPAAFTRTAVRTLDRPEVGDDTATRRAVGRRRGRSGDRRQWMALGAIAVVAAGAIGGVLMKYVFSGPSGPAHEIVAPNTVDGFTRSAALGQEMNVSALAQTVAKSSGGSASDVVSAVYEQGSIAPGSDAQIFMFVGGKLASADPGASIANFTQSYPDAKSVSPGSLGGDAACTEAHVAGQKGEAAMCVWFDNDTFGALVSPTMSTAKLASTLDVVRPSLELYAK